MFDFEQLATALMLAGAIGATLGLKGQIMSWMIGGVLFLFVLVASVASVGVTTQSIVAAIFCVFTFNIGLVFTLVIMTAPQARRVI